MAIKFTRKPSDYISQSAYLYDIAQTSDYWDKSVYDSLVEAGNDELKDLYLTGVADSKGKKPTGYFNQHDYNYLSNEDKANYFLTTMYDDPNSDDYKQAMKYYDSKVQEAIDAETYASLNGFEKTMASIGGIVGNVLNETVLGTIEGLIDASALVVGGVVTGFGHWDTGADAFKDFMQKDITGVGENRNELQQFSRKYSYLDKNKVWSVANDVAVGIGQMVPMIGLNAVAPGLGTIVYFGAGAGNNATDTINSNPDVDFGTLLTYTALSTGVEFATEKISAGIFGGPGNFIDRQILGTAGKGFTKLGAKTMSSWIGRIGLNFLSEGLEESIAEFADTALYNVFIAQGNDELRKGYSVEDILYAGLIGGLIGGLMEGGRIASTQKLIVDDVKRGAVELTKTQSLVYAEQLAQANRLLQTDAVADLKTKYRTENIETIMKNHSKQYEKAIKKNEKTSKNMTEIALGLSRIYQVAGAEKFKKAVDLVNGIDENSRRLLSNYLNYNDKSSNAALSRKINKEIKSQYGKDATFKLETTPSAEMLRLKQNLKNKYGIDVYFGEFGKGDGVNQKFGMTISENEIVLDTKQFGTLSEQAILDTVVKEELVHTLQFTGNVITPKTLQVIADIMKDEELQQKTLFNSKQKLDMAYSKGSGLSQLTEAQAKAVAEVMLFDKLTVSKMFYSEYSTLNKVYNLLGKIKRGFDERGELKKEKNKVKYNKILHIMEDYREVARLKLGSAKNVDTFIKDFQLTKKQADELKNTYLENPHVGPVKGYLKSAFAKQDDIRTALRDVYNITDYIAAGFSPEFAEALETENLKYNSVYQYIADDAVGTPEATTTIIEILTEGNNTHIYSYKKMKELLTDGLFKAIAYERFNSKNATHEELKKASSYAEVSNWVEQNKEKYHKILGKLVDAMAVYDKSKLVRHLLTTDFNYSMLRANKVYQQLKGVFAKKTDVDYYTDSDLAVGEEGDSALSLYADTESNPEEILLARENSQLENVEERQIDYVKAFKYDLNRQLNDADNPFDVRNTWRHKKNEIIKKLNALGLDGETIWKKELLPLLPKEKKSYTSQVETRMNKIKASNAKLTEKEQKIIDSFDEQNATPEDFERHVLELDKIVNRLNDENVSENPLPNETSVELNNEHDKLSKELESLINDSDETSQAENIDDSIKKSKEADDVDFGVSFSEALKKKGDEKLLEKITESYVESKTEIYDYIDEDTDIKERIRITKEAAEQDVPAHKINLKEYHRNAVDKIKSICTEMKESTYQGDITGHEYVIASNEIFEKHAKFFDTITAEDYHTIKRLLMQDASKEGRTALNLFMRYAYLHRYSQFKTISSLVKQDYAIRASESAQFLGMTSHDYDNHTIKAFVTETGVKAGVELKLPEEMILKTSPKHKTVADFMADTQKEIDALRAARNAEKDEYKKWLITTEISHKERTLSLLMDGDIAGAMDNQITKALESNENVSENLDLVNQVTDAVVRWVIEHAEFEGSRLTGFSSNRKTMSQNIEKVKKFFTTLNSFRYLMMLSNPATAIKNGASNTLNLCSAMVEDVVLKKYEKSNILPDEKSQVHFTGEYDEAYKTFVQQQFLKKVESDAEGDKYTTSELRKLQQKYAEEKDPIKKSKTLSRIQKIERKMLSDKRWVTKRTMQNLTNTLAGSSNLILGEVSDRLKTIYKIKNGQSLEKKIAETNPKLAKTYKSALKGNKIAILQLALDLKLDIVSTDLSKQDSIYYQALRRSNKTFLKVDNFYTKLRNKWSKSHPAVVYVLDQILPFARTSINALSYIIDRSPIGLIKGIVKTTQTKARWDHQRKAAVIDYYKRQYIQKESATAKNKGVEYKFNEQEFENWLMKLKNSELQRALGGDKTALRNHHASLLSAGKINDTIGGDDIYARGDALEQLAQGSAGTALMTLGVILAAVTDAFEYDDDDDYLGPVINFGGFKLGLNELTPFSTIFSVGAMLRSDSVDDNLGAAFNVIADASILSTLDSAMTYNDGLWDYVKNLPTNLLSQYQPAFTKQINKIANNKKKDKSDSNYAMKLLKSLAANSLIFSWLVPDKINPYTGEPEKYYDTGRWEALFDTVLPVGLRISDKSDFEKEAERVGATTTGMSGKFTINGSEISLKGNSKEKYSRYKAEYISKQFDRIISGEEMVTVKDKTTNKYKTTTYDKLTDEEKQRVMNSIYTNATEITKIQYWLDNGNSYYVTDKETYLKYKRIFGSASKIVYKKSWDGSKFVEG